MRTQIFIKIFHTVQEIGPILLVFRIWTSAKSRPMTNGIWQSFWLALVNINVNAIFHQNIPHGSRDRGSFTFFYNSDIGNNNDNNNFITIGMNFIFVDFIDV